MPNSCVSDIRVEGPLDDRSDLRHSSVGNSSPHNSASKHQLQFSVRRRQLFFITGKHQPFGIEGDSHPKHAGTGHSVGLVPIPAGLVDGLLTAGR